MNKYLQFKFNNNNSKQKQKKKLIILLRNYNSIIIKINLSFNSCILLFINFVV
jgi:hypothetical protein